MNTVRLTAEQALEIYDKALPGFLEGLGDEDRGEAARDVRAIVAFEKFADAAEYVQMTWQLCAGEDTDREIARSIRRAAKRLGIEPGDDEREAREGRCCATGGTQPALGPRRRPRRKTGA